MFYHSNLCLFQAEDYDLILKQYSFLPTDSFFFLVFFGYCINLFKKFLYIILKQFIAVI